MNNLNIINQQMETRETVINGEMYARFIAYLDAAPKTVETYTRDLRQFANYMAMNGITQPTRDDILSYREALKVDHKPSTVQNYIVAVRQFFRWTDQEGIYPNVADHIKGAKLDKEHKKDYLTSAQVKEILSNMDTTTTKGLRDYAVMVTMITGGLRTVEISRANVEDLRAAGDSMALFVQGKGREERTEYIKISQPVEKAIRAYLQARGKVSGRDPLFASESNHNKGGRMTTRSISRLAKTTMQAAGYDSERLTAHSLRHTAVTLSILAGKDITEVKQFARHANIQTTLIYNHALEKEKNTCAAAVSAAIF